MPHIDEGTLNALLDGALRAEDPAAADRAEGHLASCDDCRGLYDRAADHRLRAGRVLALLDADLEGMAEPDFQEVLVRSGAAGTGDDATRRMTFQEQWRWTRGLAWAATIVIALGTGYLIRDQVVPERAARELDAAASDARAGQAGEAVEEGLRGDEDATAPAPQPEIEAAPPAPAVPVEDRPAGSAAAPTEEVGSGGSAGSTAGGENTREQVQSMPPPPPAPAPSPAVPAITLQPGSDLATPSAATTRRAAAGAAEKAVSSPPPSAPSAFMSVAGSGAVATAEDRAGVLGFVRGALYALPDLPLDTVEVYDVGGGLGTRTRQRLPDGTPVILLQRVMEDGSPALDLESLQAAVAADLPAALREEIRTVMVRRDDQVVIVTAPLPDAQLRRLADQVRLRGEAR